tara:strand:- start:130 stop:291 length:162 start_codon:yes stop_codon:yes gene_type:complete
MMSEIKWGYIYGDECSELWEHFGMPHRDKDDRMKVQLVDFQPNKDDEEEDNEK